MGLNVRKYDAGVSKWDDTRVAGCIARGSETRTKDPRA